jgi:hypothetical protein
VLFRQISILCAHESPCWDAVAKRQCKREGFLEKIKEEDGEGCNVYGTLEANKVAGNFHFAPGKSFQQANMHVHDLMTFGKESFNVSHKITEISFGVHFPGVVNPLDKYGLFPTFL